MRSVQGPGEGLEEAGSIVLNVMLLLATTLFAFSLGEAAARILAPPVDGIVIENLRAPADAFYTHDNFTVENGKLISKEVPDYGLYVYGPTGVRLKRNVQLIVKNSPLAGGRDIEITTNSLGHRHRELGPKAPQELRVLALGDSITLGDFVKQDETYPALMERALTDETGPASGREVQVINAGVGTVDLANEFAILMETGLQVEPDVVTVGLYLNDAHRSPTLEMTRVPGWLKWSRLLSTIATRVDALRELTRTTYHEDWVDEAIVREREDFIRANPPREGAWQSSPDAFNSLVASMFADWGYAWGEGFWEKILPIVDLMQEVSEEKGFKLAFFLFPVSYQVYAPYLKNEPQRRFAFEMERRHLPYLDLLGPLRDHAAGNSEPLFGDHCHYTPSGYKIVGDIASDFLRERVLTN